MQAALRAGDGLTINPGRVDFGHFQPLQHLNIHVRGHRIVVPLVEGALLKGASNSGAQEERA
jgi:hypothetical protein